MTHPILSRIPFFGKFVDERFLEHRRRSTSLACIVGALVGVALFEYHYFHDHFISGDLLAVLFTMVIVKLSMMTWYPASTAEPSRHARKSRRRSIARGLWLRQLDRKIPPLGRL